MTKVEIRKVSEMATARDSRTAWMVAA